MDCPFCTTSSNSTLVVSRGYAGYSCYCFSCKERKFKGYGLRSINELQLREATKEFYSIPALPKDFSTDIPDEYAVWLYKAGIYKSTIKKYGIGFSPSMYRVVLPVYKGNTLVYMQARAVIPGMQPKYLNKASSDKSSVLFESLPSKHTLGSPESTAVVITEAILSAIRTGVYLKSYSTLGSTLTDAAAYKLSKHKCIIWYDPDTAGIEGSLKTMKKLSMLGTDTVICSTNKKPKDYNNQELQEILKEFI